MPPLLFLLFLLSGPKPRKGGKMTDEAIEATIKKQIAEVIERLQQATGDNQVVFTPVLYLRSKGRKEAWFFDVSYGDEHKQWRVGFGRDRKSIHR
jgi:hypothetical protein